MNAAPFPVLTTGAAVSAASVDGSPRPANRRSASAAPPSLATQHAPHIRIPLLFVVTGFLSLLVAMPWLALRPDILATYHYNQYVLALTHLVNLGWVASLIMGATYQLVPVALETKLHSQRYPYYHYACHLLGVVGMVVMFWRWDMTQVGHYGSFVSLGFGVFAWNIFKTMRGSPRRDVVRSGTGAAVSWLLVTMLAGLYVAASKCWSFSPFNPISQMHAHAHAGVMGFFLLMIVTISYRLVPMFTLSEVQSEHRARWSLRLLNAGLLGVFVAVLVGSAFKLVAGLLIAAGLVLHALEIRSILRARQRPVIDESVRTFLQALGLLAPLVAVGVVLAWPWLPATTFTTQLENVYGVLAIFGVTTLAILGMLHKILPFLVWTAAYSRWVGRKRVPSLADLYSVPWLRWGRRLYLAGLLALCVAIGMGSETGVRWSCWGMAVSLVPFAANVGLILSHLVRPRLPALAVPTGRKVASV